MASMLLNLWGFVRSVARHWGVLVTSGVFIGLVGVWQGTNHRVPPAVYWGIALIAMFIAFYRAWLDEHRASKGSSKHGPSASVKAEAEVIEITNDGDGAYFSVPIEIRGAINGNGKDVFAKWAHTGEVRAWIAKGQTCRLDIARLKWSAGSVTSTWIIPTVAPGNVVRAVESFYSSCAVSKPIIRAEDIVISGMVVAEPDLQNGIQRFQVVLRAFDAISVIQK